MTVTPETKTKTKASDLGIFPKMRKLDHSKVPTTTMNITPIRAATGIISIRGEATKMKASKNKAALMPERRPRPPEFTLIILCPIMAQPPIPPNNPVAVLAMPWPIHSLLPRPRVPVISSTNVRVSSDSIKPMAAKMTA